MGIENCTQVSLKNVCPSQNKNDSKLTRSPLAVCSPSLSVLLPFCVGCCHHSSTGLALISSVWKRSPQLKVVKLRGSIVTQQTRHKFGPWGNKKHKMHKTGVILRHIKSELSNKKVSCSISIQTVKGSMGSVIV